MNSDYSLNNTSFAFLKSSPTFLSTVLNNINSAILLLDKELKVRAFNDTLKTIFSHHSHDDVIYMRCGEALGCAHQVEQQKDCGSTTECADCPLRVAALKSYIRDKIEINQKVVRPFFNKNKEKINKTLEFSTRLFIFQKQKYVLLIVNDITDKYPSEPQEQNSV